MAKKEDYEEMDEEEEEPKKGRLFGDPMHDIDF